MPGALVAGPWPASAPAVELRGLTKRFGAVVANEGIHLRVQRGTIHGIVGENGAGKSTAMKLLYGLYPPDAGTILIDGEPCRWNSPADAIARGLGMVHQHFMLAGPHSALDNILLGAEPRRWGVIKRKAARARLEDLGRQYGLPVEWERPVDQLPVGIQQRVEILKLLYRNVRILILDEPTAVLTPQETNALFANLKRLRDEGKTILLVTHKLKEVTALTERVTVFRAGKVTGELETARTTPQALANLMVGRAVVLRVEVAPTQPLTKSAIEVSDLALAGTAGGRPRLAAVSFSVKFGEVVGFAGVEGNGQSELLQALLHPGEPACRSSGTVSLCGRDLTSCRATRRREPGLALIPEDRLEQGLLLERPLDENFLLGLHRDAAFNRMGFIRMAKLRAAATKALDQYDVRPRNLALPAAKLSGGNQQKLIIAREFERQPRVLLASQPTRGVDVGAVEFIHRRILRVREAGAGVLLVSSDLEEILALSDRILVMYEGRVVAEYARGTVTERELGLKMGGA